MTVLADPPVRPAGTRRSVPPAREAEPRRRLPLLAARGSMLLALLVVGGLRWMSLLQPAEPFRAWEAVGVAILGGAALAGAGRLRGVLRPAAAIAATAAMAAGCLLAGGMPDEYLRPDRWGALAAGLGRGLEALPGINVPYQGQDEWTRLVLGAGGTMLIAGATALALWPRRGGRLGHPLAALVLLVSLAVVPAVVLAFEGEYLLGAALSLLVLGFLRLETLRRRDARAALGIAAAASFVALVLAPAMDGGRPWWDYEDWALSASTTRTTSFSWNHDYSPLEWPRDGRELLRVRARQPSYWKAQNLDVFAGQRWVSGRQGRPPGALDQLPPDPFAVERWRQDIQVSVRNLRTFTLVTAGVALDAGDLPDGTDAFPSATGVYNVTRALTRGDSYRATVYTPRPTDRQLEDAFAESPPGTQTIGALDAEWLEDFRSLFVAADSALGPAGRPDHLIEFPSWPAPPAAAVARPFFASDPAETVPVAPVLERSGMGRIAALAERLRDGAATPFDYIQRVEAFLEDGFAYSEAPPATARTLDGFLFDARIGFCQQYSGAMALLLRMAGLPARVAGGFTTGALDREENEYVVRDLDAHSWVEVWVPEYGWVTRDPTPAAAPPRAQFADDRAAGLTPGGRAPDLGGDQPAGSAAAPAVAGQGGTPTALLVSGALLALALLAAVPLERRRRRRLPPAELRPMAEFERALRRARYDGGPGITLAGLEKAFGGWPGAAAYVRALREQRYSGRPALPTPHQRRSLRNALARTAGPVRAWWALPPRPGGLRRVRAAEQDVDIVRHLRA